MGGCVRYRLISSNACWQASSQMNETPFFISMVKGWHRPKRFEINLQIYANRPCNPLSSLRFLEGSSLGQHGISLGQGEFLWMSSRTLRIYRWLPPEKIWCGSSSTDVPAWSQKSSSDLLCSRPWCDFSLQYRRRSIPLFYVCVREKLHS